MWVRGLKREPGGPGGRADEVAPRVGAWIETPPEGMTTIHHRMSHPVWVRGLKLNSYTVGVILYRSRTPCGCVD